MSSHLAYPDGSDLAAYLISIGILSAAQVAALDLDGRMLAAVAQWERRTGFIPFLAAAASTRRFDPPGPNRRTGRIGLTRGGDARLDFLGGLVGEPTSVIVGFSNHSAGETLTADDHYWLLPVNSVALGRPYLEIEFISGQWGAARSVSILGRWGYDTTVPDDVWDALLAYGAWLALPDLIFFLTGGVVSWTEAGVTEQYGPKPLAGLIDSWKTALDGILGSYQRIVL